MIREPSVGILSEDLRGAALAALDLDRSALHRYTLQYSWAAATEQFVGNLRFGTFAVAA